jgi:tetratricopeptide (TPR) repeat protein
MKKSILYKIQIIIMTVVFLSSILGCKKQSEKELILIEENHNTYYEKGIKLISPYIELEGRKSINGKKMEGEIKTGIEYLDAVTKINSNNYSAYWVKGKGYQVLKMHKNAYDEFNYSFKINKENPDVARELMIECIELGKGKEAVEISLFASSLKPNDSGLIGNVALSYLISGNLILAEQNIKKAIELNPKDKINLRLDQIINEVKTGKRKKPKNYNDLL